MAYQTGTTTSVSDLITTLFSFATANGFTAGSTWTNGSYSVATLVKGGIYFIFEYKSDDLLMNTATALTGSGAALAQTGAAAKSLDIFPIQGPHVSYHMFADGNAIHVAVEITTNVFTHLNFGMITKNGSWTGGAFITGSRSPSIASPTPAQLAVNATYSNFPFYTIGPTGSGNNQPVYYGHIRSDALGTGKMATFGSVNVSNASDACYCVSWLDDGGMPILDASPNASNGRSVILPITLIQSTLGLTGPYFQLGHIPNAGLINIANLNPKDLVNTDWMVFPIGIKGSTNGTYINSLNYAMAYKK